MRFGGLKDLLKAIPAAGQGYMQGVDKRMEWDKSIADAQYKKSQLDYLRNKQQQDAEQAAADLYEKGIVFQDGKPAFDPTLEDLTSNPSRARANKAYIKSLESGNKASRPMQTLGTVLQLTGRSTEGFTPEQLSSPFDPGYANIVTPKKEVEYAPDTAVRELETKLGVPAGSFGKMSAKDYAGKITFLRGQDATQNRFNTGKEVDVLQSLKPEIKENQILADVSSFYDNLEKEIDQFNPSAAEYKALALRSGASSWDPGRLFGGKPVVFKGLSPEENKRLEYYQKLGIDAIRSQFELGGKTLTEPEMRALKTVAISPTDSAQEIKAKLPGLRAWIAKKRASNEAIIGELKNVLNPSQKRAAAVSGPTGTDLPGARAAGESKTVKGTPAVTVVKRQYSPSRNKTRITYSDGMIEEKDGKQ